jgi:RNA-dependent RNA polymerase
MDIGFLVNETTMMPMRTVGLSTNEQASVVLNLRRKDLLVYFKLPILGRQQSQEYRLKVPFSQLDRFFQTQDASTGNISHYTFLSSPPHYHRRINNIESTFIEETSWRESDTWFRQAHIVHNPQEHATLPVSLRKQNPVIDIGKADSFNPQQVSD